MSKKHPLKVIILLNLLIPLFLVFAYIWPELFMIKLQLKGDFSWKSWPLFAFTMSSIFLLNRRNGAFYFFIFVNLLFIPHYFFTVNSELQSLEVLLSTKSLVYLNLINLMGIVYFSWPYFKDLFMNQFPNLIKDKNYSYTPNLASYRIEGKDLIENAAILNLNELRSAIIPQGTVDLDSLITLQVSFNGLQSYVEARVIKKFDYEGLEAIEVELDHKNILNFVIFRLLCKSIGKLRSFPLPSVKNEDFKIAA